MSSETIIIVIVVRNVCTRKEVGIIFYSIVRPKYFLNAAVEKSK